MELARREAIGDEGTFDRRRGEVHRRQRIRCSEEDGRAMIELTVAPWPGDRLEPVVEILEPVAVMGRRLEVVARLLAEVVEADPVAFAVRILAVRRQGYRHLRAWGLGEIAGKLVESITSHRPPTSSVGRR